MAHSQLIRQNIAGLHYVRTLRAAYRRFLWISDPDYAHHSEIEAWQKLRRDAIIVHAMDRRRKAVCGLEWQLVPVADNDSDKVAAEIMSDLIAEIERFTQARYNMTEAIFRGSSWAYIEGKRRPFRVTGGESRSWWTPMKLRHVDRWRFRVSRYDPNIEAGEIHVRWEFFSVSKGDWEPLTHPESWINYAYDLTEETLGYGRGLIQALFFYWRAKEVVLTQGLAGLERWSQGLIQVGVDSLRAGSADRSTDELVDDWIDELKKHRSEHVLVSDKEDEITVHDGPGTGWQMTERMLEYLDRAITQLILMSTRSTGGNTRFGSMSQAETEKDVSESVFRADRAELSDALDRSLIRLIWDRNKPILREELAARGLEMPVRRPRFELTDPAFESPKDASTLIQQILQSGIPLKKEEVYDKIGFSRPDSNDDVFDGIPGGEPGMEGMGGDQDPSQKQRPCRPGETARESGCLPSTGRTPASEAEMRQSRAYSSAREGETDNGENAGVATYERSGNGDCKWITIGGEKNEEGKGKGGQAICIGGGGKIEKGPPKIEGKDVDDIDKDERPGTKGGPEKEPEKKEEGEKTGSNLPRTESDIPKFKTKSEGMRYIGENYNGGIDAFLDGLDVDGLQQVADGFDRVMGPAGVKVGEIGWYEGSGRALGQYTFHQRLPGRPRTEQGDRITFERAFAKERVEEWEQGPYDRHKPRINDLEDSLAELDSGIAHQETLDPENQMDLESLKRARKKQAGKLEEFRAAKKWSMGTTLATSEDRLMSVAAHEGAHAVYFQGEFSGEIPGRGTLSSFDGSVHEAFKKAVRANRVTKVDRLSVSEYAASHIYELWAETAAGLAMGLREELPKNVVSAYETVMAGYSRTSTDNQARQTESW